jgi:hypothetical protein
MTASPFMRALVFERHNGPFLLAESELPMIAEGGHGSSHKGGHYKNKNTGDPCGSNWKIL